MLFDDINELKTYVGGGANLSVELDSLEPALQAARSRLLAYIDPELFQDLVDNQASPDTEQTALLPYVQRPLALLTMYEYAHIGGIQLSEAGIMRTETETMKSAYKYQENEYKDWMLRSGYQAIEALLIFLQANASDYPLWDVGKDAHNELLLNTASLTQQYYSRNIDRWTWEHIRPAILDVETFAIVDTVGQDQVDDLITKRTAGSLSSIETWVLKLLQKATAHFSIDEAIARNWVNLTGAAVVQSERSGDQGSTDRTTGGAESVALQMSMAKSQGNRYLNTARKYLDDNSDDFPLYTTYRTALAAEIKELKTSDDDDDTTIERPEHSELYPYLADDETKKGKGIIRF